MRIFINGFGRIGRTVLRQVLSGPADVEILGINDIADAGTCAYLFAYDSTFGPFPGTVEARDGRLDIDAHRIPLRQVQDLRELDLSDVDVVMECTGVARTSDVARRGIEAGARAVLISGPSPAAETTIVLGANETVLGKERIVSNASCTTNALAPLLRALDEGAGVVQGHMTTIHCYTNSQPMVDAPRGALARSRAGALSMVPTTTSAAELVDEVLPSLAGKVSGAAVRVPTASVSAVDLTVTLRQAPGDPESWLQELADRSAVLGWTDMPLVSSDLRARPDSLVIALPETRQVRDQLRVFGWYDNEWGFSARMLDVARLMAGRD